MYNGLSTIKDQIITWMRQNRYYWCIYLLSGSRNGFQVTTTASLFNIFPTKLKGTRSIKYNTYLYKNDKDYSTSGLPAIITWKVRVHHYMTYFVSLMTLWFRKNCRTNSFFRKIIICNRLPVSEHYFELNYSKYSTNQLFQLQY